MNRKEELTQIRRDIDEAMKQVSEKHGINIKMGGISYDDLSFTMKLTVTKRNSDGVDAKRLQEWNRAVEYHAVEAEWLNKITPDGYKIVGFDSKKRKNKIILEKNGKTFGASCQMIRNDFAKVLTS